MNARCRHFGTCGGCSHQDLADADYRALKRTVVVDALSRHGIEAPVEEVVEVPPATRRRATLKVQKGPGGVLLGFHGARSHDIVDLQECLVLRPKLAALIPRLREMLDAVLKDGESAELRLTETDTGVELSLRWQRKNDAATLAELARWAARLKLARIARHGETLVELVRPVVQLGKAEVPFPSETFLQPTEEGQKVLQGFVVETLAKAKRVADLFCGCGTFALPLAEHARVHAVELEQVMLDALAVGAKTPGLKPVTVEARNLFKRPLNETELGAFDGVCLDPPRAGALDQVQMLAKSKVKRIAYVSCDAESFARDARILIDGGYVLQRVLPVDQFLWSNHIELAGAFTR